MSERFLGEIRMFGGNFAPVQWAYCDGQELPIAQNKALYSLLQTTYGGDGINSFSLPDCRGRLPMHFGSGAGLSPHDQGTSFGVETVVLSTDNLPAHTHQMLVSDLSVGNQGDPTGMASAYGQKVYADFNPGTAANLSVESVETVGLGAQHTNMMPYLAIHFIIALAGSYPSRT